VRGRAASQPRVSSSLDIVAIGDAIVDVIATADDDFVEQHALVRGGMPLLSAEQADLSRHVPMADDITVEADSGGHTDGRPLPALLPQFLEERYRLSRGFRAAGAVRIGAAGGIGTPYAAAAAIALGADYLVTGSINQVSVEAAVADDAKVLLCAATPTDFAMAPAADMFEAGAQVQVLKRGTLFAQKAKRLRHLRGIGDYLRQHRQATASQIIGDLGPVIRGWANYYRHGASKHAFHLADHHVGPFHSTRKS